MKLSTQQIQQQPVKAMLEQQEKLNRIQNQLASGKNILVPSDDPSGSTRANQLRDAMGRTNQYVINGDTAEARLAQEESVFANMMTTMQRARELAIQALNDSNTAPDRQAIGTEIEQLLQEFMGLANAQTSSGEYLFGGLQGDLKPFSSTYTIDSTLETMNNIGTATASALGGTNGVAADLLKFNGNLSTEIVIDENEQASSIAAKISADAALSGLTVTVSNSVAITVPNSAQTYATNYQFDINGTTVAVNFSGGGTLTDLATAIDGVVGISAVVDGPDIIVTNTTGDDIHIVDVTDGLAANTDAIMTVNGVILDEADAKTSNDSITVGGSISIIDPTSNLDYWITSALDKNVMRSQFTQSKQLALNYQGDNGQRELKIGDNVTIKMNDPGSALFVNLPSIADPSVDKSVFNIMYDFMSELQAGVRPSDDILADVDTAMEQIALTRAQVGSRLNIIDRQRSINEDYVLFTKQNISRIEDLDMADAIAILNQELLAMQVIQQTYPRVTGLTMFNYL